MSERSVEHSTFVVERVYDASPDRTFAAWSDPLAKSHWYAGSEDDYELDFRVGGRERHSGVLTDGQGYAYRGLFWDIVPGQRIVYTYEMHVDGARISVSLATVEFKAEGEGTRMVFTEQGAFLDGFGTPASREHGMCSLLNALGRWLEGRS